MLQPDHLHSTTLQPAIYIIADLSAFSITIDATGNTYNLAFVNTPGNVFNYFDYSQTENSFVPMTDSFTQEGISSINAAFTSGFFTPPSGLGYYGAYEDYATDYTGFYDTWNFTV